MLTWDPWPVQPAIRKATASSDVESFTGGIIYVNVTLRIGLRFRYDPASEAGTALTPRALLEEVRIDGRHLLSVLFYLVGGIPRTLNLAEVTSHLV